MGNRLLCYKTTLELELVAARSGARTAATGTTAAATAQRDSGFQGKAHICQVDGDRLNLFQQFFSDAEGEAVQLFGAVFLSWLIQSQCQTWPASATGSKVDTDGAFVFIRKIRFKLLAGVFSNADHVISP